MQGRLIAGAMNMIGSCVVCHHCSSRVAGMKTGSRCQLSKLTVVRVVPNAHLMWQPSKILVSIFLPAYSLITRWGISESWSI